MILLACTFTACGKHRDATEILSVSIVEKSVRRGKPEIEILAALSTDYVDAHSSSSESVYLFEIRPEHTAVTTLSLGELEPLLTSKVKYGDISFTIPLYADGYSRISSAFVLAYKGADGRYEALTDMKYVSNPYCLAAEDQSAKSEYKSSAPVKGIVSDEANIADAIELGCGQAIIDVSITELLLPSGRQSSTTHDFCGTTRFFNDYSVARLDAIARAYANAGISLTVRLGLFKHPSEVDAALRFLYYGSENVSEADGYAIRISSPEGADAICSLLDFIGYRYCSAQAESRIDAFIIGSCVNDGAVRYHSFGEGRTSLVRGYHELLRVAYATLTSHGPDIRIYVELSDDWDNESDLPAAAMSGRTFLEELTALSKSGTDFPWGVAFSAHADTEEFLSDNGKLQYETVAGFEGDGRRLSLVDISDAYSYLSLPRQMYNASEMRSLIISSATVSYVHGAEAAQAELLAYCYTRISALTPIDAFIYGSLYDDSSAPCGLRGNGVAREAFNVLSSLGTTDEIGVVGKALAPFDTLLDPLREKLAEGTSPDHVSTRGQALQVNYEKNSYTLTVIKDFEDGTRQDCATLFGEALTLQRADGSPGTSICATYENTPASSCGIVMRGIDPSNLRKREALALTLEADASIDDATLRVFLVQDGLSYSAQTRIKLTEYGSVMLDIAQFVSHMGDGDITAYVFLTPTHLNSSEADKAQRASLCVDALYSVDIATQESSGFGMVFIVVIIILALIVLVIEIIRQSLKLRKRR